VKNGGMYAPSLIAGIVFSVKYNIFHDKIIAMKRKIFFVTACLAMATACNSNQPKETSTSSADTSASSTAGSADEGTNPKGIGKYTDVQLTYPLDEKMVASGKSTYDVKCASCHKLTDERLVGPGWKGVTDKRTPEWIMNFITNPEEMIEKDTAAKNLLEVCLVQMPNQNLSKPDARSVLEFMRKNDGKK